MEQQLFDELVSSLKEANGRRGQSLIEFDFSLCYPFFQQLNHQS